MTRTPANVSNASSFDNALDLFPTVEAVVKYNINKLHVRGQPIAPSKLCIQVLMQ